MKHSYFDLLNIVLFGLLLPWTSSVMASDAEQNHQEIVDVAADFVERYYEPGDSGLEVVIKEPDSRISLPRCTDALIAFWPYEPGSQRDVSVGVKCNGEARWKIYLSAELSQFEIAPVLNTAVRAGQSLEESMVSMRRINVLRHRFRPISDMAKVIGMRFNRSLQSGTPLSRESLNYPAAIKRGDLIAIFSGKGGVEVAAEGYALSDGYINDSIKVRNTASKKVVQAFVIDASSVRASR